MNFYLRRQVQTMYHWETIVVGHLPRLCCLATGKTAVLVGSPVAKTFELTPGPAP